MAGISTEGFRQEGLFEGNSSEQQVCQSGEALAEWRPSEQIENGSPSTCPPYCDSDEDDDGGPKPSELFGKFTWKIEKYSQITKRELRSNPFEIGGYKWYILIYPQGCDVCNHLSLFLCVANHDKLLPGWSHFAQFTIAVVNKDPKKSKYSDTLHRFWKKEHDWGWKKFMELSKVFDGFLDADALIIKAQVQVIRERTDRPFRCLDYHYWRELVRVYLTNVEQICRRFVEERRSKLGKLLEDKARWSSFCAFWLGLDQSSRRRMSREKTESILKVVVKHFFIEKEVTSTLVMDSMYSGLKALEGQNKGKKNKGKYVVAEDVPLPIIRIEKDAFTLVDDMLLLLERAAMEPLPPKDDKGPQNRKDGTAGEEFNKDSIEHDERRLTDLGRRTIEIFVLAHIFSKIEVAYQEAVALKKQEELIREEEAAWLAETEQKARRRAADKEKRSKKKQGKQKRNSRKGKDKGREDKTSSNTTGKIEQASLSVERKNLDDERDTVFEISDAIEDISDVSDSVDCVAEVRPLDSEDREASPVNWDTDASEVCPPTEASGSWVSRPSVVQNGIERKSSAVDDSLSTSSSESIPSATVPQKGNTRNHKNQKTVNRGRNHQGKLMSDRADLVNEEPSGPSGVIARARQPNGTSQNSQTVPSLQDRSVIKTERKVEKKDEETSSLPWNIRANDAVDQRVSGDKIAHVTSLAKSPSVSVPSVDPPILESKINSASSTVLYKKPSADGPKRPDGSMHLATAAENSSPSKSEPPKNTGPKHSEKPSGHQMPMGKDKSRAQEVPGVPDKSPVPPAPIMSRPLSTPLAPPRPAVTVISVAQTTPVVARSMSTTGRLGPEATAPLVPGYVPQSYRNAIMGVSATGALPAYSLNNSASTAVNGLSHSYSQAPVLASAPPFSPHSDRMDLNPNKASLFGMANQHNILQNGPLGGRKSPVDSSLVNGIRSFSLFNHDHRLQNPVPSEFQACTSGRQGHGLPEEFPHLDIINELLEDEHGVGAANSSYQGFGNATHNLNRHYSFPGDLSPSNGLLGLSASSCRFDRSRSYQSDLPKHGYGSPGQSYDAVRDVNPQPRVNGQVDGFMRNQWQMPVGSDVPFMSNRNVEGDSFPYHIPDYQNLNVGINGYPMFRPSNGL